MIKINLLESVTDRPQGVALVEDKVSSPRMQTLLLALTVFGLMVLGMGYDYVSSNMARTAAQKELENQKRINQQMLAIQKEQMELEKKSKEVQARIDAIKKLRESQQGPSAILQEIKARFDAVPGLYLTSIEQKEGEVTIKGESPNEYSVTKFGQSLEFSNGLFSNLNIETQREAAKQPAASTEVRRLRGRQPMPNAIKPEVVVFTVRQTLALQRRNHNLRLLQRTRSHEEVVSSSDATGLSVELHETKGSKDEIRQAPNSSMVPATGRVSSDRRRHVCRLLVLRDQWYTRKETKTMEDEIAQLRPTQCAGSDRSAEPQQLQSRVQSA